MSYLSRTGDHYVLEYIIQSRKLQRAICEQFLLAAHYAHEQKRGKRDLQNSPESFACVKFFFNNKMYRLNIWFVVRIYICFVKKTKKKDGCNTKKTVVLDVIWLKSRGGSMNK